MPILFASAVDLNKNELQNAVIQVLATDPSSPLQGQIYYNSVTKILKFYTGTAWISLGSLDQITTPAGNVSFGTKNLTNLADPVNPQDAATKNYVDAIAVGIDAKPSVKGATVAALAITARTTNTLTLGGTTLSVDGVTYANGDRVLVKDSTTGTGAGLWDNGIYSVSGIGTSVVLTRVQDMDTWAEVPGAFVFIETGTANADAGWLCSADQGGTLGTTAIAWSQFSQAGTITAANIGTGVSVFNAKVGTTLNFNAIKAGSIKLSATLVSNDVTLDVVEANLTIANLGGSVPAAKMPALTGDVTSSAGTVATTIPVGTVTDGKGALANKPPARYASTVNIATLSGTAVSIDGFVPGAGDVVMLTAQTTQSQNGPWVVNAGAWTRPAWYTSGSTTQCFAGVSVRTTSGASNGGITWQMVTAGAITIDTTATIWAGQVVNIGAAVAPVGILPVTSGGTGASGGAPSRANLGATGKFSQTIGDGSSTSIVVTHGLGTTDVHVQVWELSGSLRQVMVETQDTTTNTCTLVFATAPATNAYRCVVIG